MSKNFYVGFKSPALLPNFDSYYGGGFPGIASLFNFTIDLILFYLILNFRYFVVILKNIPNTNCKQVV